MFKFRKIIIPLLIILLLLSIIVYGSPTYVNVGPITNFEGDVGVPSGCGYYIGDVLFNLTFFVDQTAWRLFYSDGSGDVKELALGEDGTYLKSNGPTSALTFGVPSGAGNVVGPATSVDNSITRFNGTDNKTIQDSLAIIDDNGSINIPVGQTYKINSIALAVGNITGAAASGANSDITSWNIGAVLSSDHTYLGITDSKAVGEDVVFGQLLYFDWTDTEWKLAKANAVGTTPAMRIALETKGDGEACLMLVQGYIRDDSAFQFTAAIGYLSITTAGAVQYAAPSTAGNQVQRIGIGINADIMYFNPSMDVGEI